MPQRFLENLEEKNVVVRLKWNRTEYKGKLVSVDNYMNLQLEHAFESIYTGGNRSEEEIGDIFIRCNNVLFIREDIEDVKPLPKPEIIDVEEEDVEIVEVD